jgi:hypothetical protein
MWAAPSGQWLLCLKKVHDCLQLVEVFALSVDAPQIPLKSSSGAEFQRH